MLQAGLTPLAMAWKCGKKNATALLLPRLAVSCSHSPAPKASVYAAAVSEDVPGLLVALGLGGSTEEQDASDEKTVLNAAVREGRLDAVRVLLGAGANVTASCIVREGGGVASYMPCVVTGRVCNWIFSARV